MMKKLSLTLALLLLSSLGLSHWYSIRVLDEAPTEQRVTNYRCLDSSGITVATQSTQAALIQDCTRIATERGGEFTAATYDSINRVTRTHAIRGSTSLQVTQADASMILVGGGNGGGAPPASSSEPYDLSAYSIPFAYSWPTAPTITSTATVDTASELESSLAVDGRRTIVEPGTYTVNLGLIGGTDKYLELQEGATIVTSGESHSLEIYGQRIVIDGGDWNAGILIIGDNTSFTFRGARDVLIKNGTYFSDGANTHGFIAWDVTRLAFVSNDISLDEYNVFIIGSQGGNFDFIFAGNYVHPDGTASSTAGANRHDHITRGIWVDNLWSHPVGDSFHFFRLSGDSDDLWLRGNQGQGDDTQGFLIDPNFGGSGTASGDVYMYDNAFYSTATDSVSAVQVIDWDTLRADGNSIDSWWGGQGGGQIFTSGTDIGDNPARDPWEGAYPAFSPWTE